MPTNTVSNVPAPSAIPQFTMPAGYGTSIIDPAKTKEAISVSQSFTTPITPMSQFTPKTDISHPSVITMGTSVPMYSPQQTFSMSSPQTLSSIPMMNSPQPPTSVPMTASLPQTSISLMNPPQQPTSVPTVSHQPFMSMSSAQQPTSISMNPSQTSATAPISPPQQASSIPMYSPQQLPTSIPMYSPQTPASQFSASPISMNYPTSK